MFFVKFCKNTRTTSRRAFWFAVFFYIAASLRKSHVRSACPPVNACNDSLLLPTFCDTGRLCTSKMLVCLYFFDRFYKHSRYVGANDMSLAPAFFENQSVLILLLILFSGTALAPDSYLRKKRVLQKCLFWTSALCQTGYFRTYFDLMTQRKTVQLF